MTIKSNNDLVGNLVKRAMNLTVRIASLTWTASLQGLFISMEAAMHNKGQESCWEKMGEDVELKRWEELRKKADAKKFREIVHSMRVRNGLEVAHV